MSTIAVSKDAILAALRSRDAARVALALELVDYKAHASTALRLPDADSSWREAMRREDAASAAHTAALTAEVGSEARLLEMFAFSNPERPARLALEAELDDLFKQAELVASELESQTIA